MSNSEPNADQVPQTQPQPPQEAPDQTGPEEPAQTPGFWQQPTEPMEREFQPLQRRSQKDRE